MPLSTYLSSAPHVASASSQAISGGESTSTQTFTKTLTAPGLAIGYAAGVAATVNSSGLTPATTTDAFASGGSINSVYNNEISSVYTYGGQTVGYTASITYATSHGYLF
jgi:hypothetical protein